jgi:hypothetical protein
MTVVDIEHQQAVSAVLEIIADTGFGDVKEPAFGWFRVRGGELGAKGDPGSDGKKEDVFHGNKGFLSEI